MALSIGTQVALKSARQKLENQAIRLEADLRFACVGQQEDSVLKELDLLREQVYALKQILHANTLGAYNVPNQI